MKFRKGILRRSLYIVLMLMLVLCNLYLPRGDTENHVHAATTMDGLYCSTCGKTVTEFVIKQPDYGDSYLCFAKARINAYGQYDTYRYAMGFDSTRVNLYASSKEGTYLGQSTMDGTDKLGFLYPQYYTYTVLLPTTQSEGYTMDICCGYCYNPLIKVDQGDSYWLPNVNYNVQWRRFDVSSFYYQYAASGGSVYSCSTTLGSGVVFPLPYNGLCDCYTTVSATDYSTNSDTRYYKTQHYSQFVQSVVEVIMDKAGVDATEYGTYVTVSLVDMPNNEVRFTWSEWLNAAPFPNSEGVTEYEGLARLITLAGYTSSYIGNSTLTLDANDGSGNTTSSLVSNGTATAVTNSFTRSGYTFKGWATSPTGAVAYNDGASITLTSDTTLYAVWQLNTYTVSYNANGGSGTMEASTIPQTGGSLRTNTFTREGYTFKGWSTGPGGSAMYSNGATLCPTSDITLYAVWEVNKHSISLNNVGTGASGAGTSISYGSTVTINAGTKEGYLFGGWTVNSGNTNLSNANNSNTTFIMPDSAVTLTANWTARGYTLTALNTGTGGSAESQTVTYGSTVTLNAGTKEGHTFSGWRVTTGNVTLADSSNTTTTFTMPASVVTVVADWTVNQYPLTIVNGGEGATVSQDVTYGDIVILYPGTKQDCYFCGWEITSNNVTLADPTSSSTTFTMPADAVVLNAVWKTINGFSASLNDKFTNTYANSEYMKNNAYNVNKNITITEDMIDATISLTDGSNLPVTSDDFILNNAVINKVGTNSIVVELTIGNCGFAQTIELEGYSPELEEVMSSLGLNSGDYAGLASKVQNLQAEIVTLTGNIEQYEEALVDIQEALKQGGIDVSLEDELQDKLQSTKNAITEAVTKITVAEAELSTLETQVDEIIADLGLDVDAYLAYDSLSEVIDALQSEISTVKADELTLIDEVNKIAKQLGISEQIGESTDISTTTIFNDISTKITELENNLNEYETAIDSVKDSLGIDNDGSISSQLLEISQKVEANVADIENLEAELDSIMTGLENSGFDIDTEGMEQAEAILMQITSLKLYAESLTTAKDEALKLLGLDSTATDDEFLTKIKDVSEDLAIYQEQVNELRTLLGLLDANGTVEAESVLTMMEDVQKTVAKLQTDLTTMTEQYQTAQETVAAREASIAELNAKIEELSEAGGAASADVVTLENTVKDLRERLSTVTADYEASQATIKELEEKLSAATLDYGNSISAMEELQKKFTTLSEEYNTSKLSTQKLETDLAIVTKSYEDSKLSIQKLEADLAALTKSYEESKAANVKLQEELTAVTKERDEIKTAKTELEKNLAAVTKERDDSKAANKKLNDKVAELTKELAALKKSTVTQEAYLTLQDKIEVLEKSIAEKDAEVKKVSTTITEVMNKATEVYAQLEAKDKEIAELQSRPTQTVVPDISATEKMKELQNKLTEAQASVAAYEQTISELESQVALLNTTIELQSSMQQEREEEALKELDPNDPIVLNGGEPPVIVNYMQPTYSYIEPFLEFIATRYLGEE